MAFDWAGAVSQGGRGRQASASANTGAHLLELHAELGSDRVVDEPGVIVAPAIQFHAPVPIAEVAAGDVGAVLRIESEGAAGAVHVHGKVGSLLFAGELAEWIGRDIGRLCLLTLKGRGGEQDGEQQQSDGFHGLECIGNAN